MARLVDALDGYRLTSTINGIAITAGFGDFTVADKLRIRARHLPSVASRRDYPRRPFDELERYADRLLAHPTPEARPLLATIEAADEVWMNGEGDYLLGASGTLWRALILLRIATRLGRPVRLTNSILSHPTTRPTDPSVIRAIHRSLVPAASVTYRDPESLALHEELFPDVPAEWAPDALFMAADEAGAIADAPSRGGFRLNAERLPVDVQGWLDERRPYVLVSGSSSVAPGARARADLAALLDEIRRRDVAAVVVATDAADGWLAREASAADVPSVPADVPLATAFGLMAGASAFVSGRYHPAIIAALVGTPPVFLASNSHKTASLQRVLGLADATTARALPTFGQEGFRATDVAAALDRVLDDDAGRRTLRARSAALRDDLVTRYATRLQTSSDVFGAAGSATP